MSIFRLTEVSDSTRETKLSWDKRNALLWDKPFHGHYGDSVEAITRMDKRNYSILSRLLNKAAQEQKAYLHKRQTVNILECACGNGRYTDMIVDLSEEFEFTFNYIGIDFADKNIEEATQLYKADNIEFYLADMLQYKTDKKFDVIFMTASISSIEQNSHEIIEHLKTMLAPKGVIAIFEQQLYCVIDNIGLSTYGK